MFRFPARERQPGRPTGVGTKGEHRDPAGTPRHGRPDNTLRAAAWKQRFYEYALLVVGLLAPWVFLLIAAMRNPALLWLPVVHLLGTYAVIAVILRGWQGRSRRLYAALGGVLVCGIVCTELFRRLN